MNPTIYAVSYLACRDGVVRVTPGIVLAFSEDEAQNNSRTAAFMALPESDGWKDHQVIVAEIPAEIDRYRISVDVIS